MGLLQPDGLRDFNQPLVHWDFNHIRTKTVSVLTSCSNGYEIRTGNWPGNMVACHVWWLKKPKIKEMALNR